MRGHKGKRDALKGLTGRIPSQKKGQDGEWGDKEAQSSSLPQQGSFGVERSGGPHSLPEAVATSLLPWFASTSSRNGLRIRSAHCRDQKGSNESVSFVTPRPIK